MGLGSCCVWMMGLTSPQEWNTYIKANQAYRDQWLQLNSRLRSNGEKNENTERLSGHSLAFWRDSCGFAFSKRATIGDGARRTRRSTPRRAWWPPPRQAWNFNTLGHSWPAARSARLLCRAPFVLPVQPAPPSLLWPVAPKILHVSRRSVLSEPRYRDTGQAVIGLMLGAHRIRQGYEAWDVSDQGMNDNERG